MTRAVCSKATQTPRVVEKQQQVFLLSSKICGTKGHSQSRSAWCARFSAKVQKEDEPETGGRSTTAAATGANQVPSPVTPVEQQGKHLDENMDDSFNLDADRLPVQSPYSSTRGTPDCQQRWSRLEENHEESDEEMETREGWPNCVLDVCTGIEPGEE